MPRNIFQIQNMMLQHKQQRSSWHHPADTDWVPDHSIATVTVFALQQIGQENMVKMIIYPPGRGSSFLCWRGRLWLYPSTFWALLVEILLSCVLSKNLVHECSVVGNILHTCKIGGTAGSADGHWQLLPLHSCCALGKSSGSYKLANVNVPQYVSL